MVQNAVIEKSRISAIFRIWHTFCNVCHVRWMVRQTEKHQGVYTMSIFDFAHSKAFAAVFAFGISALCMAAAIVPASPAGLIA